MRGAEELISQRELYSRCKRIELREEQFVGSRRYVGDIKTYGRRTSKLRLCIDSQSTVAGGQAEQVEGRIVQLIGIELSIKLYGGILMKTYHRLIRDAKLLEGNSKYVLNGSFPEERALRASNLNVFICRE